MAPELLDYFRAAEPGRRARLQQLHDLITGCFPGCTVDMAFKMPTYRFGEGWVAIANQKNYVSLYTCSAAHIEEFRRSHPGYKTGKGCINLRDKDPLPIDSLRDVVEHAILHPKGQ